MFVFHFQKKKMEMNSFRFFFQFHGQLFILTSKTKQNQGKFIYLFSIVSSTSFLGNSAEANRNDAK